MSRQQAYSLKICFAFFILFSPDFNAQFYNLPADYNFSLLTEKELARKDSAIHTNIKPYIYFYSQKYKHVSDSFPLFKYIKDDPALDVVFRKHVLYVAPKEEKFTLFIDPLINFEAGRDFSDSSKQNLYTNTRGVIAGGTIGDRFYFETMFSENQSVFPNYLRQQNTITQVVPGQGRFKTFKTKGVDYAFSSGFFSVQLFKNINLQAGHGKQKIGQGYRSLLLSDNSFNYPFARITQSWLKGKLVYTNIYAVFMNLVSASSRINPNTERLYQKKPAAFQYLSFNATKSLNIGLFQGLIWKTADLKNKQHLNWRYFNPVIFAAAAEYGLNNQNNIVAGADLKYKLKDNLNVYAQYMLDNSKQTSTSLYDYGWQAGINYFDAFTVKNLFLQFEYNSVSKNSYQNPSYTTSDQSYSHYNQNIAFTPQNGNEMLLVVNYKWHRFYVDCKLHSQKKAFNQSNEQDILLFDNKIGYLINPAYNLNICAGMLSRSQNFYNFKPLDNTTNYFYLAFRTSIYNLYYDF